MPDVVLRLKKITWLDCRQCGHKWAPRKLEVKKCPRCQSPRWQQKR